MNYQKEPCVICLSDPKQSALYFDRIVPVSYFLLKNEELNELFDGYHPIMALVPELVPETTKEIDQALEQVTETANSLTGIHLNLKDHWDILNDLATHLDALSDFLRNLNAWYLDDGSPIRPVYDMRSLQYSEIINNWVKSKSDEVKRTGTKLVAKDLIELMALVYIENFRWFKSNITFRDLVHRSASLLGFKRAPLLLPSSCLDHYNATEDDITVTISNIPLVDTTKTSWDQIIEFRKDEEAKKKLRNLRLFLHENYAAKGRSFIEDDLNKRLENYENACRDWGFESKTSYLSAILDSKSLLTTFAATVGAALFVGPIAATATGLAGASIEIGKIALTVARRKHAFHKLKRDHELAYIIEAKGCLEKP